MPEMGTTFIMSEIGNREWNIFFSYVLLCMYYNVKCSYVNM